MKNLEKIETLKKLNLEKIKQGKWGDGPNYDYMYIIYHFGDLTILEFCKGKFEKLVDWGFWHNIILLFLHEIRTLLQAFHALRKFMNQIQRSFSFFIDVFTSANFMAGYIWNNCADATTKY